MEKLKVGKHVFKIVDSVPSGYYKNSKNDYTRQRALKALNAANILSAVKFD